MGKKQKQKLILKYGILGLSLVVSIVVLALVRLHLSSDFSGTKVLRLTFSTDANLDQVVEKTEDIAEYEKIEKVNSAQVVVTFVKLEKNEEELATKYSEVEGFSTLDITEINLVGKNYARLFVLAYLGLPVMLILQYAFLNSVEKSRDRVSLIFAFTLQNAFAFILLLSILFSLSRVYPLTQEIMILFAAMVVGRLLVDMVLLFKISLAAKVNSQKNFSKFVEEFVLKYDRNFVIVSLFSTIVFLPMVLVSNEPLAAAALLGSFIALNILLETFIFTDLVYFFNFLLRKIPIVRNLKWSRK